MALPWPAGDPFPTYEAMRAEHGDVFFDADAAAWLVLGHVSARDVLRGDGWSSNPMTGPLARDRVLVTGMNPEMFVRLLLFCDPPDHTRIRRVLRHAFSPAAIATRRERVAEITHAVVDPLPVGDLIDVMAAVARPLPLAVIAEWLDLGVDGAELLWDEAPALVRLLDVAVSPAELAAGAGSFTTLIAHLLPLAVERREAPGADLISLLASSPDLSLDEAVVTALLLALAGYETTSNLIGNSLIRLLGAPGCLGGLTLRQEGATAPPKGLPAATLEELLRLEGPVQAVGRTSLGTQRVGNHTIQAGDRALIVLAAANRDRAVYADADRFDPTRFGPDRAESPVLAFGLGRHHCLGAALARLEAGLALAALLEREPRLGTAPVAWRPTAAIRGPQHLHLTLEV